MENLKGSLMKTLDKSHTGDQFHIKIDASTKETFKLVFTKLLNQLSMSIQLEQTFCQDFFNMKPVSLSDSMNLQSTTQRMSRTSSDASLLSNKQASNQAESKNDL